MSSSSADATSDIQIRVLLIDDHAKIRELVRKKLDSTGRYVVIGESDNGRSGIDDATRLQPDLIILDLSMPVMHGSLVLPILRRLLPRSKVVVFTGHDELGWLPQLQAGGADDIIGKGTPLREVVERLDRVFSVASC